MIEISSPEAFVQSGRAPSEVAESCDVPSIIIEWTEAPSLCWLIRTSEYFGVRDARWEYPAPASWTSASGGELSYDNHPVAGDGSIPGRASVAARVNGDEMNFQVTLHNDSSAAWQDAWTWICLVHRWARAFQSNLELPAGPSDNPWVPCASLRAPKGRWLKWCPIREHRAVGERIARSQSHMWQPHLEATQGAVRGWRMLSKPPVQQFVELSSPDAIILGWSYWPCTDMGLYFGRIEPGQTGTVRAKLRFFSEPYKPV